MDLEIPVRISAAIASAHEFADRIQAALGQRESQVGEYAMRA